LDNDYDGHCGHGDGGEKLPLVFRLHNNKNSYTCKQKLKCQGPHLWFLV
jgi:hypothetical protein